MKGFTLIELVVVMLIAAIIASIAVPSYLDNVRKTNRRAAQAALMEVVQLQQQFLADERSYASQIGTAAGQLRYSPPDTIANRYTLSLTASDGPPPTFTATATPVAGSTQDGETALTIDNIGTKTGPWNK